MGKSKHKPPNSLKALFKEFLSEELKAERAEYEAFVSANYAPDFLASMTEEARGGVLPSLARAFPSGRAREERAVPGGHDRRTTCRIIIP